MAARVFCAVLLCLAGCWSSTDAAPGLNTGVCPGTKYGAAECALIKFVSCADDTECTNNQKCCSNGCGLQCMAPVKAAKPGVCPKTNAELVMCVRKDDELCASDSECPEEEKCCGTACGGTRCTAPEVKPGVCPKTNAELVRCIRKDDELCADDSECPKNEKCCGTACGGTRCTALVTANPGVCPGPRYGAVECTWIKFASCADDSECTNNQKCCNNGCGLQCMAPVTVKPGVCPKTNSEIMCIRRDDVLCADDSECPKNQKCCGTACGGTRCTAPVTVKPGVCPKTKAELVRCIRKDDELCADDSECPKNQKCCGTACGGTRCTAPVTAVKPGVCPKTNAELVRCSKKDDELCTDDSECPKNQKCCRTACGGTRCTAPVTAKPGVCPKTNGELIRCSKKDDELCADDSECRKNEKCCRTACGGTRCTAPVTV